jgi:Ca-activated chloride channel family protein
MDDELEMLRDAIERNTPPVPSWSSRKRTIEDAVAQFDKIQNTRKGTRFFERLRFTAQVAGQMLLRRRTMKLSYLLAGGVSLAVLALAVVNTNQMQLLTEPEIAAGPVLNQPVPAPPRKSTPVLSEKATAPAVDGENTQPADTLVSRQTESYSADPQQEQLAGHRSLDDTRTLLGLPASPSVSLEELANAVSNSGNDGSILAQEPLAGRVVGGFEQPQRQYRDQGRDKFTDIVTNPIKVAAEEPVSTFSIDVDTSSYSFVRASLNNNTLPQKDAVRVEELVNYFPYDYASPADRNDPFKATVSVFPTPWNVNTKLVHVGIKGFTLNGNERPPANLVFLIDTSGSMDEPNKLPLLRNAMKLLVETLGPNDSVAIVAYAGNAGTVLEPTKASNKARILAALDGLTSAGSTAGAEGIRQAYQLAELNLNKLGINRVILATDGDFNVGITDPEELKSFVERKRATGVYLSVLGFGMGNYNDELMQTLAQNGNGNAAYIDTINEARKALVDGASAMLFPIATDVKIQVEFNPQTVSEYRLIGYETRLLNRDDFNNDKVDAGDIGAGHTVTAIYEVTPKDSKAALNDPLRYGTAPLQNTATEDELAFLKIRYKLPGSDTSKLVTTPVGKTTEVPSLETAPQEARFATAVAAFGQILRGGQYTSTFSYDDVIALAQASKGADEFGYRAEFINLVRLAKTAQSLEPLPQ